jgi:hypothetical protein
MGPRASLDVLKREESLSPMGFKPQTAQSIVIYFAVTITFSIITPRAANLTDSII